MRAAAARTQCPRLKITKQPQLAQLINWPGIVVYEHQSVAAIGTCISVVQW